MSTFNGVVHEFPGIAIDFFRQRTGRHPPLACFLSHVHSDHLAGLEALKSPFVYCSAATREILLKLEKRPSRIAYALGLQEAAVRTYSHLKSLLKPIPLETPTVLELEPGNHIRVTLLDANHCPGAVMFLIEGTGRAILYTGDIRSEPWWVNSIARNPSLVEYSSGLRTLDRIYLDTSMLNDHVLPTKAEGLRELLSKVSDYPDETVFCMQAWTYGYEDVWIALSRALESKIHVDTYKMGVYKSLVAKTSSDRLASQLHFSKEAPYLVGFNCGNNRHEGCLTLDENVRIHSCEEGTTCSVMKSKPIVWIQPIVTHLPDGREITEIGLGGGSGDLKQELDLGELTVENIQPLLQMIFEAQDLSTTVKNQMKALLLLLVANDHSEKESTIQDFPEDVQTSLGSILWSMVRTLGAQKKQLTGHPTPPNADQPLPNRITFPYARHSSCPELRHLIETFRPKDIWPCTVDVSHWEERGITMRKVFGPCCSSDIFEHDDIVQSLIEQGNKSAQPPRDVVDDDTQHTTSSVITISSPERSPGSPPTTNTSTKASKLQTTTPSHPSQKPTADVEIISISSTDYSSESEDSEPARSYKRDYEDFQEAEIGEGGEGLDIQGDSQGSVLTERAYETRLRAFQSADGMLEDSQWPPITLISTTDHHTKLDEELGQ
ncbi:hypothetical protein SUNI508_12726 [Seiridium unicorne]|uniref:Metallo-beta-lactamase domain-containing protein n=1 Tax=Seiridium unicorne TaxID=138068 RepID=A0ABR2VGI4_9PEZI